MEIDREPSLMRRARRQPIEYREFSGALFVNRRTGRGTEDHGERIATVRATEIRQGSIGNCAFLSAVGAVARLAPERLVSLFVDEAENGCTVLLHRHASRTRVPLLRELPWGRGDSTRMPVTFRFPVFRDTSRPCFAVPFHRSGLTELWLMALEKAYAQLHGSYFLTQVGLGGHAIATLTGLPVSLHEPRMLGLSRLAELVDQGRAVTATTLPNPLLNRAFRLSGGGRLSPTHVYQVEKVQPESGRISLLNPHGPEHRIEISFAELCRCFLSLVSCALDAAIASK